MDRVSIELEHCYGIKKLQTTLDFSNTHAYAIYAPNAVMKSSLAQTFKDAAARTNSVDRIFAKRISSRKITDEAGRDIEGEQVLVVGPYDEDFGPTAKTSTLLVDAKLRDEYAQLHVAIDEAKAALLKAVREQASSNKTDFEREIDIAFTHEEGFELAVRRIREELKQQKDAPFANVHYSVIFDDKVLKALDTEDLRNSIEDYIRRYNELLAASTFFRKGIFDYYNAGQIAKSLADNGFFEAQHTVNLKGSGGVREINTQKELETVIEEEKRAILTDKDLRKSFDVISKQLQRNAELREFCRYLQNNETLLSGMSNLPRLRADILKSYLKVHENLYHDMMARYDEAAKRVAEIVEEARRQRTQWEEVIDIFNNRFVVPFRLETRNRIDVMLGSDEIVDLEFAYIDGNESMTVDKPSLLKVLSMGERKALYVLNVIFEIQRRRKSNLETIVVVDDIADSFDYQNKYAIIEYLKEISDDGLFKVMIMTHNFDFFRTLERFVNYPNCMMASKTDQGVFLTQATGIRNIFAYDWKGNFFADSKKKIASISFLRNLIEMTTGQDDPNFLLLTSMLHWKADTAQITVSQLDAVFAELCKSKGASTDAGKLVHELVAEEGEACMAAGHALGLEHKIVLAISIRLAAEKFVITKINDPNFVAAITRNQTRELISKFKSKFPTDDTTIKVLDQVALMTPENIHLNAFMYEPLIDMSGQQLQRLYRNVKALT